MKELFDFKLLSLNVRGVRAATKRKALFTWLNERRYDIIFLQETYSTVDVEDIWRTQWRGKLFFAHGSNHSCGVMILVRSDLDFNPRTISCDDEGRSIIIEAEVQGSPFLFVNIYAPNKVQDQCRFFDKLNKNIEDRVVNEELRIILGGDFNVTLTLILTVPVVDLLEKIVQNICKTYAWILIWSTFGAYEIRTLNALRGVKEILSFKEDLIIG